MQAPRMNRFGCSLALAALLAGGTAAHAQCVVPTNGMVLTTDTTFCPGSYSLPNGITLGASGITVAGNDTEIYGNGSGNGVSADNRTNVTVRNLKVRSYYNGIRLRTCNNALVESCVVRDTYNDCKSLACAFLDIFDDPEGPGNSYGHALWLRYCDQAVVRLCDVRYQQNGISLYDCNDALVEYNDASSNSGWGVNLYATNHSTIRFNNLDDCNRIGSNYIGGDAAALLMVMGSSYNDVLDNSMRRGGDGLFLAGYRVYKLPCAYNLFARNDCSESPNNGFEATFSHSNIFQDNITDRCNYGYWLGYCWNTQVLDGHIEGCYTAGVAIEHGNTNTIANNQFIGNARGVWLWTDTDSDLVGAFPELKDSYGYTITNNVFTANPEAIRCESTTATNRLSYDYKIRGNRMVGNGYGVRFVRTTASTLRENFILDSTTAGLSFATSSNNNTVRDNYLVNSLNASDSGTNTWNITPELGTNIVSGPYRAGNYWSSYTGVDNNGDGLGDTQLPHKGGGITNGGDNKPLIRNFTDCNRNGIPDATEPDCNSNGVPDSCDIAAGASLDCNGNGVPDNCDIAAGTSADVNGDGKPDECQDCNTNGVPDPVEIAGGTQPDCNANGVPDACDIANGTSADCNANGVPDTCDIATGAAQDCNANGILDNCENAPGGLLGAYYDTANLTGPAVYRIDPTVSRAWGPVAPLPQYGADTFSIRWTGYVRTTVAGTYTFSAWTDDGVRLWVNGVQLINKWQTQAAENSGTITLKADKLYTLVMEYYDNTGGAAALLSWQPPGADKAIIPAANLRPAWDCDGNGRLDSCDIALGAIDCNGNGQPDACDIAQGLSADNNHDGVPDECADCNGNGVPDALDVANGTSADCNRNGTPDECEPDCNGNGHPDDCDVIPVLAFATPDVYATVPGSNWLAVGDLTGDGAAEIAVATGSSSQPVWLLTNNGAGLFPTHTTVSTLTSQHAVAIADFDGDGRNDLAVADNAARRLHVFRNLGNGSFSETTLIVCTADPVSLAVADMDRDNDLDLIVGYWAGFITVHLNSGDAAFTEGVSYPATSTAYVVATGDFNGDLYPDVAVANLASVSVLLNTGTGTLMPEVKYPADGSAACVIVADLNGDLVPDIAAANEYHDRVSVLLNNGNGTFAGKVAYPVGSNSRFLAAGDLDEDGDVDLVTANAGGASVSVLKNNGDGTYAAAQTVALPESPRCVVVARVDANTSPDIVVNQASGGVAVLRNASTPGSPDCDGNGQPDECELPTGDCNANGLLDACETLAAGDFNGDGAFNAGDLQALATYMKGPDQAPVGTPSCQILARRVFDANADGDIDLRDAAALQMAFAP